MLLLLLTVERSELPRRMASPPGQHAATCADRAGADPSPGSHSREAARQLHATAPGDGVRDSEDDHTGDTEATGSAVSSPPPASLPPYWLVQHPQSATGTSAESTLESGGITMRDNESEDWGGRNSACWARSVEIPDYVVVNGSATNIGAFVVFNVRVETMNVSAATSEEALRPHPALSSPPSPSPGGPANGC